MNEESDSHKTILLQKFPFLEKDKKPIIDQQKKNMKTKYNFKFLEIFSNKQLFEKCINNAENLLEDLRN